MATLNEGFVEDELIDPNSPPPAVVKVDYAVMALEDELKAFKDIELQLYVEGIKRAIEVIKLFAEGNVAR